MGGHDVKKDIIDIKKEGFWLVAERKKKIVAALTVTRYEKDTGLWVIFGLEIKPFLRGLGIGDQIVRDAVKKAREGGAKKVGLFVNKKNNPALELYRKAGFNVSDDLPSEFNRSSSELYLSYAIKS
jgi:ribosomal protein S18 acetylase RimI-like enzyme